MIRRSSPRPHSRAVKLGASAVVSTLVAYLAVTVMPASANTRVIVAMGDSYTSGEGVPPFDPATDTRTNKCHRSTAAYVVVTARLTGSQQRNVACSGSQTKDLFTSFKTEPSQVSRIGSDATDIVLSVGGNDVDGLEAVLTMPSQDVLAAELAQLRPNLVNTYLRVKAAAPKAQLHVVGYPAMFHTGNAWCLASKARREYIVNATRQLNETIRQAAAEAKVRYIDTFSAFSGHELCTARSYMNGIDVFNFRYSLHPNVAGQQRLGEVVAQGLR